MTDQYPPLSRQHAGDALGMPGPHAMPPAPQSTVPPPPPNAGDVWSTEEVMSVLQEERDQRERLAQTYAAQVEQQQQELTQWQHYAQQLQSEHATLQAQYERISQSTGASIPPGTVGDEHAQNLELQLAAAQEQLGQTAAELEAARTSAEVANQQLRMLQEHVDSVPPGAPEAPASFPPAADAQAFLQQDALTVPSDDYDTPTGQGRRFSLGVVAAIVVGLIASGAAAHFGVFAPQLEAERETTRRTQELMRSETAKLRSQLEDERAASTKQVAELTKELREAKAAAASAQSADDGSIPGVAAARKPAAKKRRAPTRRRRAARRRGGKRRKASAKRSTHANDPIAGIGL